MTKEEFESLRLEHSQSGKTLMVFLREKGVCYWTYHYWVKKMKDEVCAGELAPIHFTGWKTEQDVPTLDVPHQGVLLLFPNGLQFIARIWRTTQKDENTTQKAILNYLKEHPGANREEIADAIGNITEDGVKYNIGKLQ